MFKEITAILKLAMPILIAQLSVTSMNLVDTIMAGRYGHEDLAGVAIGGSFWLPALIFSQALLYSITPNVSQALGRGEPQKTGVYLANGFVLGMCVGACVFVVLLGLARLSLWSVGAEPEVADIAWHYLVSISLSLPFVGMYQSMRSFIEGSGRTKPVMLVNFAGLLLNIPLNYIFVYGKLGMPEMGGAGCGVASAIVMVLMALGLALYVRLSDLNQRIIGAFQSVELKIMGKLFRLGLPIAMAFFAEVSIFAVLALLIAPLGTNVVAGHQVALNITSQTFMLPLSIGLALTVRVGFCCGRENYNELINVVRSGYILSVVGALMTACLFFVWAGQLAAIYSDYRPVQMVAVTLIFYAAIYQVPDAIQACSAGILRGFKITRQPMIGLLFAYWGLALPIGYLIGRTDFIVNALGAKGLWIGLVIGLTSAAVLLVTLVVSAVSQARKNWSRQEFH